MNKTVRVSDWRRGVSVTGRDAFLDAASSRLRAEAAATRIERLMRQEIKSGAADIRLTGTIVRKSVGRRRVRGWRTAVAILDSAGRQCPFELYLHRFDELCPGGLRRGDTCTVDGCCDGMRMNYFTKTAVPCIIVHRLVTDPEVDDGHYSGKA